MAPDRGGAEGPKRGSSRADPRLHFPTPGCDLRSLREQDAGVDLARAPERRSAGPVVDMQMETDTVTEDSQTTLAIEEHPSSKAPSTKDLQEPPTSEAPLESLISETLLQPHIPESPLGSFTSEIPVETHTSETPLETHTSKTVLESSISKTPLEHHTSESLVVPPTPKTHTSETLLEAQSSAISLEHASSETPSKPFIAEGPENSPIFKGSEKLSFHPSASSFNYNTQREGLYSESSSNDVPWTRKVTLDAPDPMILKKQALSGHLVQTQKDTSAGQKEEAEEDKERVVASDSRAHTPQPGHQLGNTDHPVGPAKQSDVVEVAKAKHREQFGAQVNHLFHWEKHAALSAIQTGLYIGWRCPHYLWDCFRIGDESKCFCGHLLKVHRIISDISVPCGVAQCRCLLFCFIPSHPEEVGEFWLTRRAAFDPKAWRAQCRCKHSHEDHVATGSHPCRHKGCCCNCFESNFLCAACDRRWEEHETFFETEETRRRGGRSHGADYVPFAEMPALREAVLRNSDFVALESQRPSGHPSSRPGSPGLPGTDNANTWRRPW
ncbi:PREDICTED: protein FAM221B [Chrysochloris asiatica]|uniref:Protein FAM221B n=1 Tax=Chrysochloris asiatica TaxID=185453 RepID=A0A9B0WQ83_CHRAS|nr:PREDICTED: protein FAM221B [Chrysochloris asiatica]